MTDILQNNELHSEMKLHRIQPQQSKEGRKNEFYGTGAGGAAER
jgi:hypothetical protein